METTAKSLRFFGHLKASTTSLTCHTLRDQNYLKKRIKYSGTHCPRRRSSVDIAPGATARGVGTTTFVAVGLARSEQASEDRSKYEGAEGEMCDGTVARMVRSPQANIVAAVVISERRLARFVSHRGQLFYKV